ncbi:MAG TPA: hypothetical protein VFN10_00140 [Thermoanaerobaculia bacterium]|nr:hypothetical protein [Thermoanaerobaculia bacterium]
MDAADKRIEFLARAIVNRLEDRGLVEIGDAETAILVVVKVLGDDFAAVDAIEREARQRVTKPRARRKPSEDDVREEMRRLAAERNVIL